MTGYDSSRKNAALAQAWRAELAAMGEGQRMLEDERYVRYPGHRRCMTGLH